MMKVKSGRVDGFGAIMLGASWYMAIDEIRCHMQK